MVVSATPLYWLSFPMQLKAAIDKLYAFLIGNRLLKIRECCLMAYLCLAPLVVPAASSFMLGGNRDKSYDSRFFGCVPRDKKTCAVRWDRIGKEVR